MPSGKAHDTEAPRPPPPSSARRTGPSERARRRSPRHGRRRRRARGAPGRGGRRARRVHLNTGVCRALAGTKQIRAAGVARGYCGAAPGSRGMLPAAVVRTAVAAGNEGGEDDVAITSSSRARPVPPSMLKRASSADSRAAHRHARHGSAWHRRRRPPPRGPAAAPPPVAELWVGALREDGVHQEVSPHGEAVVHARRTTERSGPQSLCTVMMRRSRLRATRHARRPAHAEESISSAGRAASTGAAMATASNAKSTEVSTSAGERCRGLLLRGPELVRLTTRRQGTQRTPMRRRTRARRAPLSAATTPAAKTR